MVDKSSLRFARLSIPVWVWGCVDHCILKDQRIRVIRGHDSDIHLEDTNTQKKKMYALHFNVQLGECTPDRVGDHTPNSTRRHVVKYMQPNPAVDPVVQQGIQLVR